MNSEQPHVRYLIQPVRDLFLLDRLDWPTRRLVWACAFAALLAFGIVAAITLGDVWVRLQARDRTETQTLLRGRGAELESKLSSLSAMARATAAMTAFELPDDSLRDAYRLSSITRARARQLAATEKIETILSSPTTLARLRPEAALTADGPGPISLWKLTRGLPLRDSSGRYLARSRRLTADSLIRGFGYGTLSIAELDEDGRVVFMTPYRLQITLPRFDFLDASYLHPRQDLFFLQTSKGSLDSEITYLVPIRRPGEFRWLASTIRGSELLKSDVSPIALDELRITSIVLRTTTTTADLLKTDPPRSSVSSHWPNLAPTVDVYSAQIGNLEMQLEGLSAPRSTYLSLLRVGLQILCVLVFLVLAAAHLIARLIAMVKDRDNHAGQLERRSLDRLNAIVHNMRNNLQSFRSLLYSPSTEVKPSVKNLLWQPLRQLTEKVDSLPIEILGLLWPEQASRLPSQNSVCLMHAIQNELEIRSYQRDRLKFDITNLEPNDYFCRVSQADISIILSHLLTNGLESAAKGKHRKADPTVSVQLSRTENRIQLRVCDDGSGIVAGVKSNLFEDGISTKGTSGGRRRGNGLYTSRLLCEKWDGTISVESTGPQGTVMSIELDAAKPPDGIVNKVTLTNCRKVVIVDDDDEIFRYWEELLNQRLDRRVPHSFRPDLQLIKSPEEFLEYIRDAAAESSQGETYYLIDYQFNNSSVTGLNLIVEQNLIGRAVLVTNYSEDAQVLQLLQGQNVAFLPKWSMPYLKFDVSIGEATNV